MKNKLDVLKTPPKISEQDIQATMDFEELLRKSQRDQRRFPSGYYTVFRWAVGLSIVGLAFFWMRSNVLDAQQISQTISLENMQTSSGDELLQERESNAKPVAAIHLPQTADSKKTANEINPEQSSKISKAAPAQRPSKLSPVNKKPTAPLQYDFIEAKPKNGLKEMYAFLNAELIYPKEHLSDNIEGEVLVNFSIDTAGRVIKVNTETSLGDAFDQEAMRVIQAMPLWHPATVNGTAVESKLAIPLYFNIQESTSH